MVSWYLLHPRVAQTPFLIYWYPLCGHFVSFKFSFLANLVSVVYRIGVPLTMSQKQRVSRGALWLIIAWLLSLAWPYIQIDQGWRGWPSWRLDGSRSALRLPSGSSINFLMTQKPQGLSRLTDWNNCVQRKVCHLKTQYHVKLTYWSQYRHIRIGM